VTISIPTFSDLPKAGGEVALHVHTHVREDSLALFGFMRVEEKKLFEKLIGVSGIGPKLAITILSGMSTEFMVAAIRGNDVGTLTKIPGIGKKTAERMILELRDKLDQFGVAPFIGDSDAGGRGCDVGAGEFGIPARGGRESGVGGSGCGWV